MILDFFHGFCMALADSVPGVSGGTVAFILGFYEAFLNAIHGLFGRDGTTRKNALFYLAKLGLGWVVGFGSSVLLLAQLFESHIYLLSSLFLGLTLASIPFVVKEEKEAIFKTKSWPFALIGAVLVFGLTFFRNTSIISGAIDFAALAPFQYGYLFLSGALAITAMVLPGMSGSTLLLILGVYLPTVKAVHSFLHLDLSVVPGLAVLCFGILFGAAFSVRFIRSALQKHRSQTLWLILGLLLGSLVAIIMGPTTLSTPQAALSFQTFDPLGFLLGIGLLLGLEHMKSMMMCKRISKTQNGNGKIRE